MKLNRSAVWMSLCLAAVVLMFGTSLAAQEGATQTMSLFEKIYGKGSGAFGISIQMTIILTSVFMLGWTIECFINIRRDKLVPPEVIQHLQGFVEEGDLEGALQFCESAPNILTRTMAAPLSRIHSGWDAMAAAAEQQLATENSKLNYHISPISLTTALGPMLGLFGTVTGMVGAFDIMAEKGSAMTPGDVAANIGLALMSTVMGLLIAMPGMVFFWIFSNRVANIIEDVGGIVDELMDRVKGYVVKAG